MHVVCMYDSVTQTCTVKGKVEDKVLTELCTRKECAAQMWCATSISSR
jgi:hypothetical protein